MFDPCSSIHGTDLTVPGCAGRGAGVSASLGRLTRSELRNTSMHDKLSLVDAMLARIAHLANELKNDPDGHVRRSAAELRAAFAMRGAIEPAVARLRQSIDMLRANNHAGSRREFQRRAPGLDHLGDMIEQELLPDLRRLGFDL
jgi:hypothetical protein